MPSGNPAFDISSVLLLNGRLSMIFCASASPTPGIVFNSFALALLRSIIFSGFVGFLASGFGPRPCGAASVPGRVSGPVDGGVAGREFPGASCAGDGFAALGKEGDAVPEV